MGEPATVRVADVLRAALDVLSDEDYARLAARIDAIASITPTKPPREMPAPKVGMAYDYCDGGSRQVVHVDPGTDWARQTAGVPMIVRIYWPGPTPVVIWKREMDNG